ncbi:sensor histidine kinase KdpD [Marinimicrobium sp. ABcell2]|uniref:sensor histidine kinase n=1 Tax=Marinimicrobium sp. ABcell2 TaxID=3069751 RepID=UPI0027B532CF|nr:HAMP domain-containing sensor histidine kinase [Marinimicrobium sp. ABcell2]MDQ2077005.1 HAMP domain-containing sensor histidine kinase [Marinimicrobium sp. ABcell2]
MIFNLSLHNRFRLLLIAVVAVLCLTIVVILPQIYLRGMIDSSSGVLYAQANDFEQRYLQDSSAEPVQTRELLSYLSYEEIPENLRRRFHIKDLEFGRTYLEEWHEDGTIIVCYFYKQQLGETGTTLYQFQKIDIQKRPEHAFSTIRQIQMGFGVAAILLVLLGSYILLRQVVRPISALHGWVRQLTPHAPPGDLPTAIKKDEIGEVAHELKQSLQQNYQLYAREKKFLESASHELRTPVSVVRNAAELIRKQLEMGRSDFTQPLARIERSGQTMKAVIDSLLWLSRIESQGVEDPSPVAVAKLVQVVAAEAFSEDEQAWTLATPSADIYWCVPPTLLEICLRNMLTNASKHALDRRANIILEENRIVVRNTAAGSVKLSQEDILASGIVSNRGFGIGLLLTAKIAKALDWQFTLTISEGLAESVLTVPPGVVTRTPDAQGSRT